MHILVIQPAFLGDVILTTPMLNALHTHFPKARIHVLTTPAGAQVLEGIKWIEVHHLDKKKYGLIESVKHALGSLLPFQFDYVFSVHRSPRSLFIAKRVSLSPNGKRIAFSNFWSTLFRFETESYPPYQEDTHYADKPLKLLQKLAISDHARKPILELTEPNIVQGEYLVLSPFSVWGTKMWFSDRFAKLAIQVAKKYRLKVVLTGANEPHDLIVGETIAEKLRASGVQVENKIGKTSLAQLKSIIQGACVLIANDSAPIHIAAAFDTPTLAIFGPTVKKLGFFPLSTKSVIVERNDVSCRPCSLHGPKKCPKVHFECMDKITVDQALQAADQIMDRVF